MPLIGLNNLCSNLLCFSHRREIVFAEEDTVPRPEAHPCQQSVSADLITTCSMLAMPMQIMCKRSCDLGKAGDRLKGRTAWRAQRLIQTLALCDLT